jgi:hypothetical protein
MNIVKAIYKIKGLLTDEELDKLEHLALQYQRYARIFFKIEHIDKAEKVLVISVYQEKSPSENYLTDKDLRERAQGLFMPFFEDYTLNIGARCYMASPVEEVTPNWIKERMNRYKVGNKQLVKDLGLSKAEVSALVNGHREMGIRTKGLFYYYFKSLTNN